MTDQADEIAAIAGLDLAGSREQMVISLWEDDPHRMQTYTLNEAHWCLDELDHFPLMTNAPSPRRVRPQKIAHNRRIAKLQRASRRINRKRNPS
jgi:hypothetical protein